MISSFTTAIVSWSEDNPRELPWKETNYPYHIWLREIILQQTRVEQGAAYYKDFLQSYPSIHDLAQAPLDEIYKKWEGLGYYNRAKNLHFAAQQIVNEFDGEFPNNFKDLLRLKGVGNYTAAAISSFAFKKPYAVLDGNVFRVLSRYFGVNIPIDSTRGKKHFQQLADQCLDTKHPDVYNQAIMDFGATLCTPRQPLCDDCPLSSNCIAYHEDKILEYPVKSKKIIKQERFFNFIVIQHNDSIIIQQRKDDDIWKNLFQFPLIESKGKVLTTSELLKTLKLTAMNVTKSKLYKQALTHRLVYGQFFHIEAEYIEKGDDWLEIPIEEIKTYSFPKIIREYLNERFYYLY